MFLYFGIVVLAQISSIQLELERIVNSKELSSSPRLIRFLRYCVEQTCAGRLEELKESVIGVNVFDRAPGYDPKADPIVRVHARRLREKLDVFYASVPSQGIIVRLPKGSYVARFEEAVAPATPTADVVSSELLFDQTHVAPQLMPATKRRQTHWMLVALVLGLAIAVAAVAWIPSPQRLSQPAIKPLVTLPGSANDPSWAPDGRTVAFTWDGNGSQTSKVYTLKIGQTVPHELTNGNQAEYRPVWASDGKSIALLRETTPDAFAIVLVDSATKTDRVVRTIVQLSPMRIAPALDWSPDGKWLVTSEQSSSERQPVHLLLVSSRNGESWVITDPPNGSTGDLEARFSPDGKRILFRRGGQGELFMLTLKQTSASTPSQLTFQNAGVRGLSWSHDGKTVYFGCRNGHSQFGLCRLLLGDRNPTLLTPPQVASVAPALDPTSPLVAFAQPAVDVNLWLYSLHESDPRLLVPSVHAEYSPEFSPDGRSLAFVSDRSGDAQIWIASLNGGQPVKVTSLQEGDLPMSPSWSPDGKKIAYFCRRRGLNYAYETDIATGATRPLKGGEDYALFPQYSNDGTSYYYLSNAGRRFRIWRTSLANSAESEPVVAEDVRYFRISKDRRSLYFLRSHPQQQLVQMNLESKEEKILWTFRNPLESDDAWDVAGDRLFFLNCEPKQSHLQLMSVELKTAKQRVLGEVHRLSREWQTGIATSPDGESAVVTEVDSDRTALMLLRVNN